MLSILNEYLRYHFSLYGCIWRHLIFYFIRSSLMLMLVIYLINDHRYFSKSFNKSGELCIMTGLKDNLTYELNLFIYLLKTVIRILVNPKSQEENNIKYSNYLNHTFWVLRLASIFVCKMRNWCSLSDTLFYADYWGTLVIQFDEDSALKDK